jgi:serine/threonine-protein kinase PRP4
MASRSASQSEGEVFSSDSESKAKSIPSSRNYSKVDRHTRPYQASRDAVPSSNRSRSRSPYRASRGEKRSRDSDHARGRSFNDSRTLSVRHEDDSHYRHRHRISYEDRNTKRSRTYSRSRSRSRSPYRHSRKTDNHRERSGETLRDGHLHPSGRRIDRPSMSPKPIGSPLRDANPKRMESDSASSMSKKERDLQSDSSRDFPNSSSSNTAAEPMVIESKPLDEASLIEERRRRREAIKNKYRGQAPSLLVQALHVGADSTPGSPAPGSLTTTPRRSGQFAA